LWRLYDMTWLESIWTNHLVEDHLHDIVIYGCLLTWAQIHASEKERERELIIYQWSCSLNFITLGKSINSAYLLVWTSKRKEYTRKRTGNRPAIKCLDVKHKRFSMVVVIHIICFLPLLYSIVCDPAARACNECLRRSRELFVFMF